MKNIVKNYLAVQTEYICLPSIYKLDLFKEDK